MNEKLNNLKERKVFFVTLLIFIILLIILTLLSISKNGFGIYLKGDCNGRYSLSIIPLIVVLGILSPILHYFHSCKNIIVECWFIGILVGIFFINNIYLIIRVLKNSQMTIFRKILPFYCEVILVWILSVGYWVEGFIKGSTYIGLHYVSITASIHFGVLIFLSICIFIFYKYANHINIYWHNTIILILIFFFYLALMFLMFPQLGAGC
jgi:hypothetical protein